MTTTATTTPSDVLAKLQAAWRTPSPSAANVIDGDSEATAEPATLPYCGPHNDPAEWKYLPDKYNRAGWRAVHCKRCEQFIGFQPPQAKPSKRRQPGTKGTSDHNNTRN